MESKIVYKCGCVVDAKDQVKITASKYGLKNKSACPVHFETMDHVIFTCDCGTVEISKSLVSLHLKKLCKRCTRIEQKKRWNKMYSAVSEEHILTFACGCMCKRKDAYKRDKFTQYECPTHREKCVKAEAICTECGDMYVVTSSYGTMKCPDCRITYNTVVIQPEMKTVNSKEPTSTRRTDCKHRSKCLVEYQSKRVLPCRGCKRYVSAPLDILSYIHVGDSMGSAGRTHHGREWRGDRL